MIDPIAPDNPMPAGLFSPTRLLAGLLCATLLSLAHTAPATADCQPDADAAASEEPYTGYTPTGYKGAWERDAVWHRTVRASTEPDGKQVYQLRAKMAAGKTIGSWYDSIEPVDLGGRRPGFVARHAGCAHLLDAAGRQLATPAFSHTEGIYGYNPPGKRLHKLVTNGPNGTTYRYALFAGGRLKAVSPHAYLTSYYSASLPETYLPKNFAAIAVNEQDGHGLIDLDTLDEIIQPVWRGVGGLGLANEGGAGRYLLADDGKTRTLFSADGRTRLLGNIDKITLIADWFAHKPGLQPADRAIIAASEAGEQTCRLFDVNLNLLLPLSIPLRQGECPSQQAGYPPRFYVADTDDGQIHVFSTEQTGRLQPLSVIAGNLVGTAPTGMVITWVDTPQGKRYRAFMSDGKRANEDDFDEFRHLGCGFFEVRKDTKWLTLRHDGSVTEKRYYPFSC
jgi:hypothetical protein